MKIFNFHQHLLQVLVALISLAPAFGGAIRLNANGGYDIVIGVEDNTPEPLNVLNFLDEIRSGVEQFSTELWKTTHRRFYINSVDVLVPGHWWTVSKFDTATWQTLLGSEIRITHDVESPNVVNPNPCGTSGLYVELPDKFFKVPRGGLYGAIGKAMVNLWARYRFGVWEEHGIPGDTKFPYFYVYPSFEPKWEATGCSNEEITGSFRTFDGEISERCDPYGAQSPDDDCRYIPSPSNTANSSLMHLHWLDSVTEFCDSKTHNYVAPNRQNLFCGHRSVWEVIRESDDYKATKVCTDSVAQPKFRVLKESKSPEFYLLLDRGRTVTPEKVLKEIMAALNIFISYPSLERINIAVGTYPHTNQGRNHYYVKEEIGWAPISSVFNDIERVLSESSHPDGPVVRDFGLAIQEVVEQIKQRNHQAGTVLLVVKRGAGPNTFDKITFEQEVIASVKEDSRIQVFAIEAQQGDQTPYTNLQSLVSATNGQYHMINDTVNTAKKLEKILWGIQEKLEQSSIMNSISSWVTQKQYTKPHESIEIPIYDNANIVKIHLTTHKQMVETDIYLEQVSGEYATTQLIHKGEWDENNDLARRVVFTYVINNPAQGSLWSLKHGCHTEKLNECRFFLVVTAHTDRPTPRISDIDMTDMIFNSQSITVDVSTSAGEYNYVDMSEQGLKIVPFAIFAKIEMDQQRVLGLENVTALIRLGGEHNNHLGDWTIPLSDDGRGVPDVAEHDGIYSGVFTPLENGLYQISVSAVGVSNPTGSSFQDIRIVNHAGGLMQMNQINYGCKNSSKPRCASAVPRGSFSRTQDLRNTIAVENAGTFKPGKPTRILDFTVKTYPNFNVEFEFTSPKLLGSDESPDEFLIYMAPHVDNFIGSTELTKLLITSRGDTPGTLVKIPYNAASKAIPYYAVEAMYGGQKGGPSNVVGVVPSEEGELFPSPTTTTTRPTTSTTEFPTSSTSSTTEFSSSSTTSTTEFPSSSTTSTTEYPWPSTASTTESPFPTTTEESEETDFPIIPSSSSTPSPTSTTSENTESPISTTTSPSTTEGAISSTVSPTTTTSPPVTSDITDPVGSSTTTQSPSSSTTITSTTEGLSSTVSPPITSDITDPVGSSTTTQSPSSSTTITSTTEGITSTVPPPVTSDITDPVGSSTTTQSPSSSTTITSTTEGMTSTVSPPVTSDITDPVGSSTTTQSPSSSTTITSTTEGITSTVSQPVTSDITDPIISSTTSTTTEVPSSTPDEDVTAIPTEGSTSTIPPSTNSDITDPVISSTTTESTTTSLSTTTTEEGISSTSPPTTTDITDPIISTTSTTTEPSSSSSHPSTTTEEEISSTTSPTTVLPPVTSDITDPSSTTTESSTTTNPSSSTSTTSTVTPTTIEPPLTSDNPGPIISTTTSGTTEPSTSSTTTEEDISSTTSPTTVIPPVTSDLTDPSSTTTESSTSTLPSSSTSTTEESTSTISPSSTEPPVTSPSSTTEKEVTTSLPPSTTTEGDISSTAPSTTLPPITSDSPISTSTESSTSSTSTSTDSSTSSTSTDSSTSSTSTDSSTSSTSTDSSTSSTSTDSPTSSTSTSTESSTSSTSTSTSTTEQEISSTISPSTSTSPPVTSDITDPSTSGTTSTTTDASSSTSGGEVSTHPTTTTPDLTSPVSTPSTPVTEHSLSGALTLRSSGALLSILMLSILVLRT